MRTVLTGNVMATLPSRHSAQFGKCFPITFNVGHTRQHSCWCWLFIICPLIALLDEFRDVSQHCSLQFCKKIKCRNYQNCHWLDRRPRCPSARCNVIQQKRRPILPNRQSKTGKKNLFKAIFGVCVWPVTNSFQNDTVSKLQAAGRGVVTLEL